METDERRDRLRTTIAEVSDDPALSTFLARGTTLTGATLTRISLAADLTQTVIDDVLAHAAHIADREFIDYAPSYQLASNQVIADDLAEVPALRDIVDEVQKGDVATDAASDEPVIAMIHRVEAIDTPALTVIRLSGAGIATKRARGVKALLLNDGVFVEVSEEIVFYEPRFDALVSGDDVIVSTISLLARRLEAPERAQAVARTVLREATKAVAIKGFDELQEAVATDPAMNAKMMAVSRLLDRDPEYAQLLTTERLVAFLHDNPQVGIDVEGEGANAQLVYDSAPNSRYKIVKALADDYLYSQLSERHYEAGSKQRI